MTKPLSIFFILISLIVGILLGNQYGRRDLVNSKATTIEGITGQPGAVNADVSGIELLSLPIYARGTTNVYGAMSLATTSSGGQAIVYLWQKPAEATIGDRQKIRAIIYSAESSPSLVLTEFFSTDMAVRMNIPKLETGQYIGFVVEPVLEPILVTDKVN